MCGSNCDENEQKDEQNAHRVQCARNVVVAVAEMLPTTNTKTNIQNNVPAYSLWMPRIIIIQEVDSLAS